MGTKTVLHEEGTLISNWPAAACVLHREIPPPHDYSVNGCKGAAPSNPAEPRFQIRPSMVGTVPPVMERHWNDVRGGEVWLCGHSHLGRIRVMGVRSLCVIGEWFQLKWPDNWLERHITVKELLQAVLSIAIWGHMWRGGAVRCCCNNAAVVAILRSGTSKNKQMMHLVRSLFFLAAGQNISIVGEHIPGVDNRAADALSRDNRQAFISIRQEAASRLPVEGRGTGSSIATLDIGELDTAAHRYFTKGLA